MCVVNSIDNARNKIIVDVLDTLGLILIGIIFFCYFKGGRNFAEINIQFSLLNFPIFIGEILIGICMLLYLVKKIVLIGEKKEYFASTALFVYFLFVIVKALFGYFHWGPLAFRHAAMFYYLIIACFVCSFSKNYNSSDIINSAILILIIAILNSCSYYIYYLFPIFILACILFISAENKKLVGVFFVIFLCSFPYRGLYGASRTMIVSNIVATIYLIVLLFFILPYSRKAKVFFSLVVVASVSYCILNYADKNALKSIFDLKDVFIYVEHYEKELQERLVGYEQEEIRYVKIYNPEMSKSSPSKITYASGENKASRFGADRSKREPERSLKYANVNTMFRLFIWEDMLDDIFNFKPVFGFNFGKPLMSERLEILNWGSSEWKRDGWIGAHNSYLHIIYRAGLIGIILIVFLFYYFMKMTIMFVKNKSVIGILLNVACLYWMAAANFLLIYELPYNAISFWCLLGLACSHYRHLKVKEVS